VVAVLGRYGDTHVRPDVLFDVDDADSGAGAPAGAFDVQLRCPVSLSVLLDGMRQAGLDDELAAWGRTYRDVVAATVTQVQRAGGYVADGHRRDLAPARLEIAAVVEDTVAGYSSSRWHAHIYVGPTAVSLLDGVRWPVDAARLEQGVFNVVWPSYMPSLEERAAEHLDVSWGEPRPGAVREIVDPPWHDYIDHGGDRGVCRGPWGPRRLLLADASDLEMAERSERQIAYERAHGLSETPPWDTEPELHDDRPATRA